MMSPLQFKEANDWLTDWLGWLSVWLADRLAGWLAGCRSSRRLEPTASWCPTQQQQQCS
jgi:hypothetical protein